MNEHQVIARKWRPQTFGDVVGQTHVIRTLRNAIVANRVGHAYLLVGPRGIGKTTIARIFAKAINCENPRDGEPCCACASCKAIAEESSLDVIEVDAASRNSVDHMRALSEEAFHMPVASKYKIYIIDEVHMLSKAAWNALLKTVEEPPAHVKFIFATTEAHQVLPTIVSRCQRFDLRPIPGNLILERLKLIAAAESVKIAPEALRAIARAAEGGMRDAQSSLEQMLSFFGGKDQEIEAEQVLELFGLSNAAELDALVAALLGNRPEPVITIISELAGRGRNLETLFDDILEMLRGAELIRLLRNPEEVLEFDPEKMERCRKLAEMTTPAVLRSFMESLTPVGRILHEALNKAIYLESILLKAMHDAHAPTLGDVLARLNQMRSAGELKFLAETPPLAAVPLPAPAPAPAPAAIPAPAGPPQAHATMRSGSDERNSVPPPPPPPPAVRSSGLTAQQLFDRMKEEALNRGLALHWDDAAVQSLENSVLTVCLSGKYRNEFQAARMQLLEILQQLSGDWAILLDLRADMPEPAVPAPDAPEAENTPEADAPEMSKMFTPVEAVGDPVENPAPAPEPEIMAPAEAGNDGAPEALEAEEAPVSCDAPAPQPELADNTVKRSVFSKPDEVENTAKLPPVKKVLDLFDGEIVDIHA